MEKRWEDMSERLVKLTNKQLKQIAYNEAITLNWAGNRKDTLVAAIVAARRRRALRLDEQSRTGRFRNVAEMRTAGVGYKGELANGRRL